MVISLLDMLCSWLLKLLDHAPDWLKVVLFIPIMLPILLIAGYVGSKGGSSSSVV